MALQTKTWEVGDYAYQSWSNAYKIHLTLTENSTDISKNTSSISYKFWISNTGNNRFYQGGYSWTISIGGQTIAINDFDWYVYPYNVTQTIAEGTITVAHNSDGSLNMAFDCGIPNVKADNRYAPPAMSITDTWALTNIPRAATLVSAPDFNDEANPTITYSNPAGTAMGTLQACISLTGSKDDIAYRDISKTGTSYTFSLTTAERDVLRAATLDGTTRRVIFYVKSVVGGNTYYSTLERQFEVINCTPTVSPTVTVSDTLTKNLTGNSSTIIKGISSVNYTIGATAYKKASITSQSINDGVNYYYTATGSISNPQSGTFTASATDNRKLSATGSKTLTFLNYVKPTCYLETTNPTPYETGSTMTLKIKGNYWTGNFGATRNTLTVKYRVKEGNGSFGSQKTATCTISGTTYTSSTITISVSSYHNSVTIEATVFDAVFPSGISTSRTVKSEPVFDWSKDEFNFNVPVSINGNVTVNGRVVQLATMSDEEIASANDYVVEQSISGIWSWRKWNSGIAECWGTLAPASVAITSTWGAIYAKDNAIERQSYPIVFTTVPVVSINLHNTSGNCWHYTGTQGSASMSPAIGLASGAAGTVTVGAQITAIGRWK